MELLLKKETDEGTNYFLEVKVTQKPFLVKVTTIVPDVIKTFMHPDDSGFPFKVICKVHSNDGFTRYTGEMSNKSGDLYEFNFDVDPDQLNKIEYSGNNNKVNNNLS